MAIADLEKDRIEEALVRRIRRHVLAGLAED